MSVFCKPPFDNIIVLDVETPNRQNDSICQIGLLQIQNGVITNEVNELINPDTSFDAKNISIHGITEEKVADKQFLDTFWDQYSKWFDNVIVVGQNVKFDVCVLTKALKKYDVALPELTTLCTLCLAKRHLTMDRYDLESLCNNYDIVVNKYHDSGDDAKACWNVLLNLEQQFGIDTADLEQYSYCVSPKKISDKRYISYAQDTKVAQELKKLVEEIMEDGIIEEREVLLLKSWLDENEILMGYYPYDKICETIYNVLDDGYISLEEYEELKKLFSEFIDPVLNQEKIKKIQFEEKVFCLTGKFEYGDKAEIEKIILQHGGTCSKGMSSKVNYLIVGGTGDKAWKFGNYGSKVQKALELKDKGKNIIILNENDFFNLINQK